MKAPSNRTKLLVGLAAFMLLGATAGRVTYSITSAAQYTRSAATGRMWGMSFSQVGDFKILMATNATAETEEQLFRYDAQVAVSCSERNPNRAHRSMVLGCWTQTQSATVSVGPQRYCDPAAATPCVPPVYNLGANAGFMTYTNVSYATTSARGMCFAVAAGVGEVYAMVPSSAFRDGSAAGYRTSACSSGQPCLATSECFDSTTCSPSNTPIGVFLGFTTTSTSVDCVITEAL